MTYMLISKKKKNRIKKFLKERVRRLQAYKNFYLQHYPDKKHSLSKKLIVSLTSYPSRYSTLKLTLMSLLSQTVKPDIVILWVYKEDLFSLPKKISKLKKRGLIIKGVDTDLRSYNKLIHALKKYPEDFIVTADDDIYYPENWLESLINSHVESKREILCCRAHRISKDKEGCLLPYKEWEWETGSLCDDEYIFPTGTGGVLYPPESLHKEVFNEKIFLEKCEYADDIWLYFMFRLNGYMAKKVDVSLDFYSWRGTEKNGLARINVVNKKNDIQMKNLIEVYGNPLDYKRFSTK